MKKQSKKQQPKKALGKPAENKSRQPIAGEAQRAIARIAGVVLVVALLGVMVMMIAAQFFPDIGLLNAPRRVIAQVFTPVQKSFSALTDNMVAYLRKLKLQDNIEKEYNELLARLDELTNQNMLYKELEYKLQQYADLDDELQRNPRLDGLKATIIGRDASNYTLTLTIDKGSNHGIKNGLAVVYSGALVGYTYGVEPNSSKVLTIVDTSASVHALIESSRDIGQIKGTLAIDGTYACRMYHLEFTTLPRPGDRVVTSGVGIEFIKGIPIGYVRESTRGLEDSKQFIVVEPIVDFNHLEYVIVYRYLPATPEQAVIRGVEAASTLVPLPSLRPVPTLIGQAPPELTPGPDGQIPPTETPTPSPTPSPSPTPAVTPDPNATLAPPNVEYNMKPLQPLTDTPAPTGTPTPSPEPQPTFNVQEQTVEDDE